MPLTNDELETKIALLEAKLAGATNGRPTSKARTLEEASPEAWFQWRTNFETVASVNKWNNSTARLMAKTCMYGPALDCVEEVDTQAKPAAGAKDAADYKLLLDVYEKHMVPNNYTDALIRKVKRAKQRDGESAYGWHARFSKLYKRAYPARGNTVIDYNCWPDMINGFIDGLANAEVANLCRMNAPKGTFDYAEALDRADQMEGVWRDDNRNQLSDDDDEPGPSSGKLQELRSRPAPAKGVKRSSSSQRPTAASDKKFTGKCFNCNRVCGYRAADCRQRQRSRSGRRGPREATPQKKTISEMRPQDDRYVSGNE